MSYAQDQKSFMTACGQTVGRYNYTQARLYLSLIEEEIVELLDAMERIEQLHQDQGLPNAHDLSEVMDAIVDSQYVLLGLGHSLGMDPDACWDEVHRSNMTKIDPTTGTVLRRADGKILKPDRYQAPELLPIVQKSMEQGG